MWALPGGKQKNTLEPLEHTAIRELREETGLALACSRLSLIDRFTAPGRDPRGPFVSFAYLLRLFSEEHPRILAGDDASQAQWFPLRHLPPLAFDHADIIRTTLAKLARTLLTGHLVHDAFRHVEALAPLLAPWDDLPELICGYYEEVARFLRERLLLCESCGWQQERAEPLHEVAGSLLCGSCIAPAPAYAAAERLVMQEVSRQWQDLASREEGNRS
jgi:8-oxo-dGTP diphosphatase